MDRLFVWWSMSLVLLVPQMMASDEAQQLECCQGPLRQNMTVPWAPRLKGSLMRFVGTNYRKGDGILPKNSFVAAPTLEVCSPFEATDFNEIKRDDYNSSCGSLIFSSECWPYHEIAGITWFSSFGLSLHQCIERAMLYCICVNTNLIMGRKQMFYLTYFLCWSKWFINTVLYISMRIDIGLPSCSSGCMKKYNFYSWAPVKIGNWGLGKLP